LIEAVVVPSERVVYGIYRTNGGEQLICTRPLTDAELNAHAEHPETFFGVIKPQKSANGPLELYDFFHGSYGNASSETLLRLMADSADSAALRRLSREDLAMTYCERLVYATLQTATQQQGSNRASQLTRTE
jgi:hypothetical protein